MRTLPIATGWELKQRDPARPLAQEFSDPAGWIPAVVPGTVHEALLAAGRIPDPFFGCNELEVQWVGEADWLYRCVFTLSEAEAAEPAALCFDGLDTVATVWLNDLAILAGDNMFVPYRVPVAGLLRAGRNTLAIRFASALRHGQAQEAEHGRLNAWNTDPSRVYVRKAQYHYGWDWGPCLITAGPWRPVRLELGGVRIAEIHCPAEVGADLSSAELPVRLILDADGAEPTGKAVWLRLFDPAGRLVDEVTLPAALQVRHSFSVSNPDLWWPNGHGGQPRYRLVAVLLDGEHELEQRTLAIGLRRLRLVQEPVAGEAGSSFLFEVNGRPLFAGGANWIPADNLTPRIARATYRRLLSAAAAANMVILRVWGGGIYEDEAFYELCDELGLLVWQDFMFACGMYPAHESFLASVRAEAAAQVRRLRHHACIALWCGNNEDYQIAGAAYEPQLTPEANRAFPARLIYERLLPEVCAELDPTRPYWPGSPYGGPGGNDATLGDRHVWDVWHGAMAAYQRYGDFTGRFVSEFGMQAAPAPETLRAVLPPGEDQPQSRTMDHHNKAPDGPQRLAAYLAENLRAAGSDLDTYCYQTQLLQAEAITHAYRAWRRRWHGAGRYAVGGALVWQLNDCWPVVSWALIDSALRPKAALYAIRRELAPLALGLAAESGGAAVWAVNATPETVCATLVVRAYKLDGSGEELARHEVQIPALGSAELGLFGAGALGDRVVAARLLAGDTTLARATLWPEPLKNLDLPDPDLTLKELPGEQVELRCARPAKGVWLSAGDGVAWEDNNLDLLPDEPRVIRAPGLGQEPIRVRWLGLLSGNV
jgi:beta-mannosidase